MKIIKNFLDSDLGVRLGSGSYSTVYTYKNKYAIKILNTNYYKHFNCIAEIVILNGYKNKSIIQVNDIVQNNSKIGIILEKADHSLEEHRFRNLTEKQTAIQQIIKSVEYLHSKSFLHLDLKPSNILVKGDTFLLADFSCSRKILSRSITVTTPLISE